YGQRELELRISTLTACDPEIVFAADIQDIIRKTLESLPEQTRQIFEMNHLKNRSKKEIASTYGITVKGVDYHLYKALKSLRENLKDYYPLVLFLLF
ncbi:MAG: sigma-70 family RNA polymerase sigma factor, partial [Tannerella sp.]|nr:sigma-70 family RNA polymerase sigma factor [Tannerella sp.]